MHYAVGDFNVSFVYEKYQLFLFHICDSNNSQQCELHAAHRKTICLAKWYTLNKNYNRIVKKFCKDTTYKSVLKVAYSEGFLIARANTYLM
jgi:hypothetical protein